MLADWIKDYLIQLPEAPSWRGPIVEFEESVRDSFESSPHLAHKEYSILIDGLLVAHLLELEISSEDFDGLSHEIVNSADLRLKPLRRYLEAVGDFHAFSLFMSQELALLPPKVPGTPRSALSLVTSVALDPLAHAPASPKVDDSPAPRRPSAISDLPVIPELKQAAAAGVSLRLPPDSKKALTEEEISRRLERLQNLKMHISKTRPNQQTSIEAPVSAPSGVVPTAATPSEAETARRNLTLSLLQDLKK